jgi:YbbR domain-containing protein
VSIKHATFDDSATVLFGSLTASFVDLLALSDDIDLLAIYNTTDDAITLNVPSGTSVRKSIRMPATSTLTIDCRSNSKRIAKGTIQVKYSSGAPTTGEVTIVVMR